MNTDTVLFAIQGGLELYGSIRQAYVDGTIGASLVLPLPRSEGVNSSSALTWFGNAGKKYVKQYPRVAELVQKSSRTAKEKREIVQLYLAVRSIAYPSEAGTGGGGRALTGQELHALLTIRQWKTEPKPTALQQIAGTLINLSVDYFLQTPGAISERRPGGRALRTFLEALDTKDFATRAVTDIAPDLLLAVLDSVSENPDLIRGGEKEQLLVQNVTESMVTSAKDLLKDASSKDRADGSAWIQLVARSMIAGGSKTILENPKLFFEVKAGEEALITRVGKVMTELVLSDDGVDLRPLLSGPGLQQIVSGVLETVAQHPELLHIKHNGIRLIVGSVAEELATFDDLLSQDLFAALTRLVLEKTALNLDVVWGANTDDPDQHLLLLATRSLLTELSKAQKADGSWKPDLSGDLLLSAAEGVFQDVIDNPQWVIEVANKADSTLGRVVAAVMASLKNLDGELISTETGLLILRASISAVGRRLSLLDDLPSASAKHGRTALNHVLDAIFNTVFDADSTQKPGYWVLARNSALLMVVEISLDKLAKAGVGSGQIQLLTQTIEKVMRSGDPFDGNAFGLRLEGLLQSAA